MSSTNEPDPHTNRARRHFLGLAAATGAKVAAVGTFAATILPPSLAHALGDKWWKKNGGGKTLCLLRGTMISTPSGEIAIENLAIGDAVHTARGGAMPIKWIGWNRYNRDGKSWKSQVLPIRIAKDALADGVPHRDLYVSPGHGIYLDGVFMRAADLVNGTSITPAMPANRESIEYFQIVLDSHEAVIADGASVETFLVRNDDHENFTNFAEFARLYPEDCHQTMAPYAPFVGYGGRKHLKALLRLGARRAFASPRSGGDTYDRIADRAELLVSQR